jgi:hypothetical protein
MSEPNSQLPDSQLPDSQLPDSQPPNSQSLTGFPPFSPQIRRPGGVEGLPPAKASKLESEFSYEGNYSSSEDGSVIFSEVEMAVAEALLHHLLRHMGRTQHCLMRE